MTRIQQTVATYFRYSLMDLLNKMVSGTPHFVRCLKPNDMKMPGHFSAERITTQLRYTGVLETTRIRRLGYSHRIPFSEFLKRYHVLGFRHDEAVSVTGESCKCLLNNLGMTNFAIGKSKVFLKYYHMEELAQCYEEMCHKVVRVQSYIRMWLARTRFHQLKWKREKASIIIQKNMRCFVARKKYTSLKNKRNEAAVTIQKAMKGHITRKRYKPVIKKRREAAVKIQSNVRGYLCRKQVQKMKSIQEEEEEEEERKLLREAEEEKARKIQKYYRMYRLKKRTDARLNVKKEMSATKIQAYFRMWRERVHFKKKLKKKHKHKMLDKKKTVDDIIFHSEREDITNSSVTYIPESPSKKVWEKLSARDVGESRLEQMKKMNDLKEVMPQPEADYYNSVNNEEEISIGGLGGALTGLVNLGGLSMNPSVVINNEDGTVEPDFDMDEEVMNFMHGHIHRQLMKFTHKAERRTEHGLMDRDTKAYFEEVIRGSGLFGLLPSSENDNGFGDDEEEEDVVVDYSQAEDNDPDYQSESGHVDTARNQLSLSRILLAKKVAEAFMANKPDKHGEEGEEDNSNKKGVNQSDSMNSLSWDAPLRTARENALAPDDYNENHSGRISRHSEFSIEADLQTERENLLETNMAD